MNAMLKDIGGQTFNLIVVGRKDFVEQLTFDLSFEDGSLSEDKNRGQGIPGRGKIYAKVWKNRRLLSLYRSIGRALSCWPNLGFKQEECNNPCSGTMLIPVVRFHINHLLLSHSHT